MGSFHENKFFKEKINKNETPPKNYISIDMFKSIKSHYIIKTILSLLNEKKKLNMIIYNKMIQHKLGIDIENYKKMSGKLFTGDKNGIGKEYILDTEILIFKGNYLNGKKNLKGNEYDEYGNIKFEGEYINGYKIKGKGYNNNGKVIFKLDKNGKGKEYYSNGVIQFEGEYLNGKRWNGRGYNINGIMEYEIKKGNGIIKEYYYNDKLKFEGVYLNGEKIGKGKEYNEYGDLLFEGEYFYGKKVKGKVKEYDKVNGQLKFEGEYLNAEKSGKGIEYDFECYWGVNTLFIVFEGDYLNGKRNGKGKEYKYRDLIFEGEYRDGKRNGKGKEYNNGNLIFEGEYLDGKKWNGMEKIYIYYI